MSYCDFRKPCHDVKAFPQNYRNISLNGKRIQDDRIFYKFMAICAKIYNYFRSDTRIFCFNKIITTYAIYHV